MNSTAHPIAHRYPYPPFLHSRPSLPAPARHLTPTHLHLSCRLSVLRFLRALPALATSPRRSRSLCHLQLTPPAPLCPPNPPTPPLPHLTSSISLVIRSSKPTLLPSAQHTLLPLHVIYSALISPSPSSQALFNLSLAIDPSPSTR
jgi:hypothetical protein